MSAHHYVCVYCGHPYEVPADAEPIAERTMDTDPPARYVVWANKVGGDVLHACRNGQKPVGR